MIVRRITAGAAGLALAGTAFAAAPASAKSQGETEISLNGGLVQNLTADGVKLGVIKPAKAKKGVITLPIANRAGVQLVHNGGIKFTGPAGFVSLNEPTINFKTGAMDATVVSTNIKAPGLTIAKLAKLTGGKKNTKKGFWKNATWKLSKTIVLTPGGDPTDPAPLLNGLLGTTAIKTGQKLGKITVTLNK